MGGQPGLIGWFGELLTEKYNPKPPAPIDMACWDRSYDDVFTPQGIRTVPLLGRYAAYWSVPNFRRATARWI